MYSMKTLWIFFISSILSSFVISKNYTLEDVRKMHGGVSLNGDKMKGQIDSFVMDALNLYPYISTDGNQVCQDIVEKLEKEYEKTWNCFIGVAAYYDYSGPYVDYRIPDKRLVLTLYHSLDKPGMERGKVFYVSDCKTKVNGSCFYDMDTICTSYRECVDVHGSGAFCYKDRCNCKYDRLRDFGKENSTNEGPRIEECLYSFGETCYHNDECLTNMCDKKNNICWCPDGYGYNDKLRKCEIGLTAKNYTLEEIEVINSHHNYKDDKMTISIQLTVEKVMNKYINQEYAIRTVGTKICREIADKLEVIYLNQTDWSCAIAKGGYFEFKQFYSHFSLRNGFDLVLFMTYEKEFQKDSCYNNTCHSSAECISLFSTNYICKCGPGYRDISPPDVKPGSVCELDYCSDIDCPSNTTCVNRENFAECVCSTGMIDIRKSQIKGKLDLKDSLCLALNDVNECALGLTNCSGVAVCKDFQIGYLCRCPDGYIDGNPAQPGRICSALSCDICNQHSDCIYDSRTKNVTCVCKEGYSGKFCEVAPSNLREVDNLNKTIFF